MFLFLIDYFCIFISVVLLAIDFVLQNVYQRYTNGVDTAARFSMTTGIFSILIVFAFNRLVPEFSWYSLLNAFLKAFAGFLYTIIGFSIMKRGKMVLYTLFLMSGGMLLPAIYGWCFLGDPVIPLRLIGTAIILISIILSNIRIEKTDFGTLLKCICVFFLNGCVSILTKLHQINTVYPAVSTTGYAMYSAVLSFGMSMIYYWLTKRKEKSKNRDESPKLGKKQHWMTIGIAAVYSLIGTISSLLQLEGAKKLPASVLYPIITGGSVVLTGIFSFLFFKEKTSRKEWCGIFLCFVGTLLFL